MCEDICRTRPGPHSYLLKVLLVEPVGDTRGSEDGAEEEGKREHEGKDKAVGARGPSPHHQSPPPPHGTITPKMVVASEGRGKSRGGGEDREEIGSMSSGMWLAETGRRT